MHGGLDGRRPALAQSVGVLGRCGSEQLRHAALHHVAQPVRADRGGAQRGVHVLLQPAAHGLGNAGRGGVPVRAEHDTVGLEALAVVIDGWATP